MRVARILVIAYTDQNWEEAKGIVESKGHQAFRGETIDDLAHYICCTDQSVREDSHKADGVLVVGRPRTETDLTPIAATFACMIRSLYEEDSDVFCIIVQGDDWAQEMQRSLMKAEDCLEKGGE
jgi:hypothetical protein